MLDKKGQEAMRKVCRLTREVLDTAAREVRPGVTTDYIDEVVHKACLERDVRDLIHSTNDLLTATGISLSSQLLRLS